MYTDGASKHQDEEEFPVRVVVSTWETTTR